MSLNIDDKEGQKHNNVLESVNFRFGKKLEKFEIVVIIISIKRLKKKH